MRMELIGVIGAGTIGTGVAQDLAASGYRVLLLDVTDDRLDRARTEILKNIRLERMLKRGTRIPDSETVLSNISFSTDYACLERAGFIIENVTEKWAVKRDVYKSLDSICPASTIFAANTSAIPITRIASVTSRPTQVIGLHMMNPVPLKSTVEVIRGFHTSEDTVRASMELLTSLGKEAILVNDSPGFVSNRVLMLTINEAIFLLHERVAKAEDVDRLFRSAIGHKMGPLETADLIGLDTILFSIEVLHECFGDSKYRPCPLLKSMVEAGLLGRKSGSGFYSYT
ncbi:MAG TPA: 3-hydroxyacyl-CoA dehydrogenase NAD-binding domain-containing protein [Blastocatellia bacterium]|nr:3-hydroxyacyl-CoA dehydrogenase NAD-binding domain-containing protein [Blastocatellia bacterium]